MNPSSRYRDSSTRARSSPPRSGLREQFSCSKRFEHERSWRPEKRHRYEKSSIREDKDRELCMKKLSEFNESLRRQGPSTSIKFQWNYLLYDYNAEAAAPETATMVSTKPELATQNEKTATTYSMNSVGMDFPKENRFVDSGQPHLKVTESGFVDNGDDFRYSATGNWGFINDAVYFDGHGEILEYDSSVINEIARERIRRNQELRQLAYQKIRARASPIDAIIDKIDGTMENKTVELNQHVSLPHKYTTEEKLDLLHVNRHQQREDCSGYHALNKSYFGFSGHREEVGGYRTDHPQRPKVARFHGESGSSHVLHQVHPDFKEMSRRNEDEQEVLGWMNHSQNQYKAFLVGESQQFQHRVHLTGRSRGMEQTEEDLGSRMKFHQSPMRAPKDYDQSLPRDFLYFGRESHVKEERKDVSDSSINHSQARNRVLLDGERQDLQEDCGQFLPRESIDLNVVPHEAQKENDLLDIMMTHHHKRNEAPLHGEKQQMQEDCLYSLPQHYSCLHGESHLMDQETEVLTSKMNHPENQRVALFHDASQQLQHDSAVESYPVLNQDDDDDDDDDVCTTEGDTQQISATEELSEEDSFNGESQQLQHDCTMESYPSPKQDDDVCTTEGSTQQISTTEELGEEASFDCESQQLQHDCAMESYPSPKQDDNVCTTEGCTLQISATEELDKEASFNGESQQLLHDCALEMCPLPKQDDDVCTTGGSTKRISATEELGINSKSPAKTHVKNRIIDLRKIRQNRIDTSYKAAHHVEALDTGNGGERSSDRNSGFERHHNKRSILFDYLESQRNITHCDCQFNSTHMPEFAQPPNRKNIKLRLGQPSQVHCPNSSNSKSIKERLGLPCQVHPDSRNIKKRLGPRCQVLSIRRNIKQRLGPPSQIHNVPQIERRHKMRNLVDENVNHLNVGARALDGDLTEEVKRGRSVPAEDSKEFKQLIHDAFLKYFKVLNENPAQRRKYIDKGEAETLKCSVCGSKSKEFVGILSLVMHAFTSQSVRLRVEHLGLHKALCVLMGWKSMAKPNCLWAQKRLPEALAMKEDLIVWPPIVILHNSSVATTNSDDQIIVSIEELEAFLAEMGFCREIFKVCRGKPANQSIMTVIFRGTVYGLQEAERLHQLYAENKHGRAEFQQIDCSGRQTLKMKLDKVEDVLYGYMAIAGDLDKVDFVTKSRSVIRSKEELYARADTLTDTE